ncbi:ECF transporter S component [Aneurinibacillus uraniidurans]|uniref:ECF transporter S component n=1 Tax=Aneurinibacillus uraniidurans TaxID=2966586 RepID=UPI00234A8A50|nr:ECF transporter S component [Aneurinibacillus sp. B1]WCN39311.1 ECF transporter S component [Aneurinibacillus sp. B1]
MRGKTRRMAVLSLLSAIGFLLMFIEIPLPIFPMFLKLGISEIPALVGATLFGPLAGVIVELLKNVLHAILYSQDSMGVGELSNFIAGSTFVVVSVWFMKLMRESKLSYWVGTITGTIVMACVMGIANYFIFIPAYGVLLGKSVPEIVAWSQSANSSITSLWALILYAVFPFNLMKGIIEAIITYPIYQRLRPTIKTVSQ